MIWKVVYPKLVPTVIIYYSSKFKKNKIIKYG